MERAKCQSCQREVPSYERAGTFRRPTCIHKHDGTIARDAAAHRLRRIKATVSGRVPGLNDTFAPSPFREMPISPPASTEVRQAATAISPTRAPCLIGIGVGLDRVRFAPDPASHIDAIKHIQDSEDQNRSPVRGRHPAQRECALADYEDTS